MPKRFKNRTEILNEHTRTSSTTEGLDQPNYSFLSSLQWYLFTVVYSKLVEMGTAENMYRNMLLPRAPK